MNLRLDSKMNKNKDRTNAQGFLYIADGGGGKGGIGGATGILLFADGHTRFRTG